MAAKDQLARRTPVPVVQVKPPVVRVKVPTIKIPEIKLPTINVPPVDLGPLVRTMNGLINAMSDLRGVVAGQAKIITTMAERLSNLKVTTPPRPRTYEVQIDDGDGGTRTMRVRASK